MHMFTACYICMYMSKIHTIYRYDVWYTHIAICYLSSSTNCIFFSGIMSGAIPTHWRHKLISMMIQQTIRSWNVSLYRTRFVALNNICFVFVERTFVLHSGYQPTKISRGSHCNTELSSKIINIEYIYIWICHLWIACSDPWASAFIHYRTTPCRMNEINIRNVTNAKAVFSSMISTA